MRPASRIIPQVGLVLFLLSFVPVGELPQGISAQSGRIYKIDFRSHPALTRAWDAVQRGHLSDPRLAELPGLADARLIRAEGNRAWIRLEENQAEQLRELGVRLSVPRMEPDAPPRAWIQERAESLPSPSVLRSLAAAVNAERMMAQLSTLAPATGTRYYSSTGMQNATQYAYDRFVESGLDSVYFDNFTYRHRNIRNVVGIKQGSTNPSQFYMIGGHLDSTSPDPQTVAPGAEDNGSGSVGVLEAARLFGALRTDATLIFVCFTAEEQGLIGSTHLAAVASQQNWDLRGMLSLDMVGYDVAGSPDLWIEGFHANSGSVALMDLLEASARSYTDLRIYRYPGEGEGSDHESFNSYGFPAILAIDNNWDSYPCYHQTCDVVGNIDPGHFRSMIAAGAVTMAQAAGLTVNLGSIQGIADKADSGDDSGVTLELAGTGYASVVTGAAGAFWIPELVPGTYTLRASAPGYSAVEAQITVSDGQAVDVRMTLGNGTWYGDLNNDHLVTQADFSLLAGLVVGYFSAFSPAADVFLDGVLDCRDLLVLALYLAGRIPSLPVYP